MFKLLTLFLATDKISYSTLKKELLKRKNILISYNTGCPISLGKFLN